MSVGRRGRGKPEKAKDFSGSMKKLLAYCRKYLWVIVVSLALSVGATLLTLIGPSLLQRLTKEIQNGLTGVMDMDAVLGVVRTLALFYLLSFVLNLINGQMMVEITQKISYHLRDDIARKMNRLPMGYFHSTTTGDILSRITNDVDTISTSLSSSITSLITAVIMFVGTLFMMFTTNVQMSLTAILSTIFGFGLMFTIMGKSQTYFSLQQKSLGELNGHIEEIYSGHTVVKAYNGEKEASELFTKLNETLLKSGFLANALSGLMMPIMSFIGNFGYVAVCVMGSVLAMNGVIGFEVIVAFMLYVRYFTQPLQSFAQGLQTLQSAAAASERVFSFLEAEEMADESDKPALETECEGQIEFEHVRFGYTPEKEIIHDFSAVVKPGQKIALVGPTGAGKTTIVNLLMRFYETTGGDILLDGHRTKDLRRSDVRKQFCMVLQDTWLFEGTIKENLIYNQTGITDEQVKQACKAVGLHHYIKTLPHGYDTVLSDQVSLSQGQKQQLTIARAMLADKPMLILDEATSSVDTRTERQIQMAMDTLMKGRTSFVIAHRLSTIKNADLILVLNEGDVVESGTHEELLQKHGFYADLYNSQFEEQAV